MEEGRIRQFVAMSLGEGYTVEEQLSGAAEWGGIQIIAYPMKAAVWEHPTWAWPPVAHAAGGADLSPPPHRRRLVTCRVGPDVEPAVTRRQPGGSPSTVARS
ncbi:MAG: hypothetical protein ACR2HR_00005 [Euzebya sp.]